MIEDKSFFVNFVQVNDESVTFGHKNKAMICCKGSISSFGILELKEVHFVDGLKENLIIISQICDDMYLVKFK